MDLTYDTQSGVRIGNLYGDVGNPENKIFEYTYAINTKSGEIMQYRKLDTRGAVPGPDFKNWYHLYSDTELKVEDVRIAFDAARQLRLPSGTGKWNSERQSFSVLKVSEIKKAAYEEEVTNTIPKVSKLCPLCGRKHLPPKGEKASYPPSSLRNQIKKALSGERFQTQYAREVLDQIRELKEKGVDVEIFLLV